MVFIDKKELECLVAPPRVFMASFILSGKDFANSKQNPLSKLFQRSRMVFKRSL